MRECASVMDPKIVKNLGKNKGPAAVFRESPQGILRAGDDGFGPPQGRKAPAFNKRRDLQKLSSNKVKLRQPSFPPRDRLKGGRDVSSSKISRERSEHKDPKFVDLERSKGRNVLSGKRKMVSSAIRSRKAASKEGRMICAGYDRTRSALTLQG